MINVVNKRTGGRGEYCGRPNPLGNPFPMRGEATRDAVCDQYQQWFETKVKSNDPAVMTELRKLYRIWKRDGQLNLVCWCAPKRCHCDTIKQFLEAHGKAGTALTDYLMRGEDSNEKANT